MLDIPHIRAQFPALARGEVFLDNPGGTQVPEVVIEAVVDYYRHHNANLGGAFRTSADSERVFDEARRAMADLLHSPSQEQIVFGQNMTTLTFHLTHAMASHFGPGDEILVTRLDHDANISPWVRLAEARGAAIKRLPFDPADCTLRLDTLDELLTERTKLFAIGYASNAVGTINPVEELCRRAREVGAWTFVDAVQYVPHGLVDVDALGCDFLACSAYKFFGPHIGILWGRPELLEQFDVDKVRPAKNRVPDRYETGTLNHEGIAGTRAAVDYLASLAPGPDPGADRRIRLEHSLSAMEQAERELCGRLLDTLEAIEGVEIRGITDRDRMTERVPTVAVTVDGRRPREVAEHLGRDGIFVWDGDYYAVDVIDDLGLRDSGGMVRIGLAHYNSVEDVERLGESLARIAGS